MAKTAAYCILFMMVMAFAVQQAESTIILKSLILGALLKKLFHHKDKIPIVPPKPVVRPLPPAPKPVIIKKTARPVYPEPTRAYPMDGRRLMEATA